VESFKSTLDSVYRADLVLLVVDVSAPIEEIREKLVTCHDTLYERNEAPIVTVLNKIDAVTEGELAEKRAALSALAPDPVAVSAIDGTNVEALTERIEAELPERRRERLVLPLSDDAMTLVSWVHDHAYVEEESYEGEQVILDFEATGSIVERARARASDLVAPAES
jgi:GTP-binding protein HflX